MVADFNEFTGDMDDFHDRLIRKFPSLKWNGLGRNPTKDEILQVIERNYVSHNNSINELRISRPSKLREERAKQLYASVNNCHKKLKSAADDIYSDFKRSVSS